MRTFFENTLYIVRTGCYEYVARCRFRGMSWASPLKLTKHIQYYNL